MQMPQAVSLNRLLGEASVEERRRRSFGSKTPKPNQLGESEPGSKFF
jgi:hypothetical protein